VLRSDYAADAAVLVDSGTNALRLAMASAMTRTGGNPIVALPGFSCFDIAAAAVGADARVVMYDIDPKSLGPDEDSLRKAFVAGARIVVVAPLYGMPVQWDRLQAMAAEYGALLVEDAAQGHGASWNGRPLGSLGAVSVLSFGRGKGWTGGSGGAVLTREGVMPPAGPAPRNAVDARGLAGLAAQWVLGRPSLYALPRAVPGLGLGETVYHDPRDVSGMSESAATSLLANREVSVEEAVQRRATATAMISWLRDIRGIDPVMPVPSAVPGFLRLPVLLANGSQMDGHWEHAQRLGIARSYPLSLRRLSVLRSRMVVELPNPGADSLATLLITLPTHSLVSSRDMTGIRAMLTGL
jgi:perosamine synthetase